MAWIEAHQELAHHPKIRRLARELGVPKAQAIGHLLMLWLWAVSYATGPPEPKPLTSCCEATSSTGWSSGISSPTRRAEMGATHGAQRTVSAAVWAKGERLAAAGLVASGRTGGSFRVKGDHGLYRVELIDVDDEAGMTGICSCEARAACSHMVAALLHGRATGTLEREEPADPFHLV
jgi:hypothetical protein